MRTRMRVVGKPKHGLLCGYVPAQVPALVKSDRLAVLQAEVETIVKRLKVTNDPDERKILLGELRQILDQLDEHAERSRREQ